MSFLIATLSTPSIRSQLAASLPQLLSATVGGVIAFAVSLATNWASNTRLREQFALEKEVAKAKELRQKGEELFVLLHFWTSHISGHYLQVSMAMQGKLTLNQVHEAFIERANQFQSKYEAPRIELYIKTYFPSCVSLHAQLIAIMRTLNGVEFEFQETLDNDDVNRAKVINKYVASQLEFERCNQSLQQRLVENLAAM